MKSINICGFLLLMPSFLLAQQFQGQAVYEAKLVVPSYTIGEARKSEKPITDATREKIALRMKALSEKTFVLDFNKYESSYTEEQKLEAAMPNSPSSIKARSTSGKVYQNISEKMSYTEKDIFGKEFLVKDSLPQWNWELTNEKKVIGEYQCNKAIIKIPVTAEEKAEYEQELAAFKNSTSQVLTPQQPKEQIIIAWYTPEIPVSHGPHNYWGLPGLILELSDAKQTLLCSKITLNPEKKTKIKRPTSGKEVTWAEFKKIEHEKLESLKDGSGQIQIQIQR